MKGPLLAGNNKLLDQIVTVSERCHQKKRDLLILGDFNCPEINWKEKSGVSNKKHISFKLLETVQSNLLTQMITNTTHHRALQTPTLIDLIITNNEDLVDEVLHQPPLGKSHHDILSFKVNMAPPTCNNKNDSVTKLQYHKGNYDKMRDMIGGVNWDNIILNTDNFETSFVKLDSRLDAAIRECIPTRTFKPNDKKRKFVAPPDLLNKIRRKRTAFKYYKKFPTVKNHKIYLRLINQVKWGSRKAAIKKEKGIAKAAKTNPKAFFNYASTKLKPRESVPNLRKVNGELTVNDHEKACLLNSFLASVFTKEDLNNTPTFDCNKDINPLSTINITQEKMLEVLKSLNPSKSPGPDQIHPKVLKELANELSYPLTLLFNKSVREGKIRTHWKEAEVRPIFKKGDKTNPGNYRPVSLTSVMCKVFETFVRDALYKHLTTNNLLSDDQFGFCKGRSCDLQLLVTIHDWMIDLDNNIPTDAIYLDLSKAFDTVPHQRLLNKLKGYGIGGNVLSWVSDFLTDRSQYVSVNGSCSNKIPVFSGVPQGSVLGPILFIYYINDLPSVTDCNLKIFADDTKAYTPINSIEDRNKLQLCINNLNNWTEKWLLKFNSSKCKVLHIGENNPQHDYFITVDGKSVKLEVTTSEKDLGVYIDPNLTFEDHINTTVSKARSLSGLINYSITFKSSDIMVPLYKAFIRPVLEYANSVWHPYFRKHINTIESVQRLFTKRIIGMKDYDYHRRLQLLKLPSLEYRRVRGDMIQVYKICQGLYDPITTKNLINLTPITNDSCTTRNNSFKTTKTRPNYLQYKYFFTNRINNLWRSLPEKIVCASSTNSFKNLIDIHLKDYKYATNFNLYYTNY